MPHITTMNLVIHRNDDTLMEEDDDGKEEDAPEVQFSKKARISLHGASAMSPNLMANLSQALKKSRPGDRKVGVFFAMCTF